MRSSWSRLLASPVAVFPSLRHGRRAGLLCDEVQVGARRPLARTLRDTALTVAWLYACTWWPHSDDGGVTWSAEHLHVPFRQTPIDANNSFAGKTDIMWSVDQAKVVNGETYYAFTKIGAYPQSPPEVPPATLARVHVSSDVAAADSVDRAPTNPTARCGPHPRRCGLWYPPTC